MASESFEYLDDGVFRRTVELIDRATGIFFDDKKREILRLHLKDRAIACGCKTFDEYLDLLESSAGVSEMTELSNKIVVHQTEFFRNRPQFEALEKLVLPNLLSEVERYGRSLRVWSAGCSTGEEPYSIAMVVAKVLARELEMWNVQIVATDISEPILDRAKEARYSQKATHTVPEPFRSKFLRERPDEGFEVVPELRKLVSFRVHNLVKDDPPPELAPGAHLVFCRNVTIYFSPKSLRTAMSNMEAALWPGGYLFLGHSESLLGIDHSFELVDLDATFAYRKPQQKADRRPGRLGIRELAQGLAPTAEGGEIAESIPSSEPRHWSTVLSEMSGEKELPAKSRSRGKLPRHVLGSDEGAQSRLAGQAYNLEVSGGTTPSSFSEEAHAKEVVAAAQGFLEKGDPEGAKELVRRELERFPTNAALHFLYGSALHALGDDGAAAVAFGKSIYCDPRFSLAYFYRGALNEEVGNLEAASRDYSAAMRLLESDSPGRWDPYLEAMDHFQLVEVCRQRLSKLAKVVDEAR